MTIVRHCFLSADVVVGALVLGSGVGVLDGELVGI